MKVKKLITILIADILLAALFVAGWPVTRYISIERTARQFQEANKISQVAVVKVPETTPVPAAEETPAPAEASEEPVTIQESVTTPEPVAEEPAVEAVPDTRTPWQKSFEEYFTDDVQIGDNSYSSPNVAITTTQYSLDTAEKHSVYFVADVHIGSLDCFRSYFAMNAVYPNKTDRLPTMAKESNSILAVNGDYCGLNFGGIVLRNGIEYMDRPNGEDVCVLWEDGVMECLTADAYHAQCDAGQVPYQVWTFGPTLLGENGKALNDQEMSIPAHIADRNPRTAIGYYEPGHYCFVTVDGRQRGYSDGVLLTELSEIMSGLGCKAAYNLDGGGSTMMYMNGAFVNQSSSYGERGVTDILLIAEPVPEA